MPSAQAGGIFLHQNRMYLNTKGEFLLSKGVWISSEMPPCERVFRNSGTLLVHYLQNLPLLMISDSLVFSSLFTPMRQTSYPNGSDPFRRLLEYTSGNTD